MLEIQHQGNGLSHLRHLLQLDQHQVESSRFELLHAVRGNWNGVDGFHRHHPFVFLDGMGFHDPSNRGLRGEQRVFHFTVIVEAHVGCGHLHVRRNGSDPGVINPDPSVMMVFRSLGSAS